MRFSRTIPLNVERRNRSKFFHFMRKRLATGRNIILVVLGDVRQGKSAMALTICEGLDKKFHAKKVLWDLGDGFDLVDVLPALSFMMIDEACVALDAQRWNVLLPKFFTYVVETYGWKQINSVYTLPDFEMLHINVRRVCQFCVEVTDRGHAKVFRMKSDHMGKRRKKRILTFKHVPMPSNELWEAYSEQKKLFYEVLTKNMKAHLSKMGWVSPYKSYVHDQRTQDELSRIGEGIKNL